MAELADQIGQGAAARGRACAFAAAVLAAALFLGFATALPAVTAGEVLRFSAPWAPWLGISFTLMLDGLSLFFALLITGIGAPIFLWSAGYMGDHRDFARLVLWLCLFMIAMLGLVLAGDLITLFVFWELTSLTSYMLIGFGHEGGLARRNALQALLVTAAGGLALLAGLVLIAFATGSSDLGQILASGGLQEHALYPAILVLVLCGAVTKSAQFPFHFWLPGAMAAPTPVSAFLHSATMVKAGIWLLARLHPVLGGSLAWQAALGTAGLVTALLGAWLALRQNDLKQVLAATTLMALGTLTLMLAGEGEAALSAAMVFLLVHALYKAALFLVAGALDHATGSRELSALSGLRRAMPLTALAAWLAGASMAGLPPFLGWTGKELLYAGLDFPWFFGLFLANALIFACAGLVALRPFTGPLSLPDPGRVPREVPRLMLAGPLLFGVLGLVFGLAPWLLQPLLRAIVAGSLQAAEPAPLSLHLAPGWPLVLSLATFALGTAIWLWRGRRRPAPLRLRFDPAWDRLLDGFRVFAGALTRRLQSGRQSRYLTVTFLTLAATLLLTLALRRPLIAPDLSAPLLLWLVAGLTAGGALLVLRRGSRIANIAGIGTTGIGLALIFILYGAPDVALTQLMVETLAAILFGIALLRLPGIAERRSPATRRFHALIAGATGLCLTLIVLAVTSHPLDRRLTTWFEDHSLSLAHGRNVVNVILVDFRAFDTFGELTVILLASVGAYALLTRRRGKGGARR